MADIKYISDFLNDPNVEGKRRVVGYVPCQPRNFTGAAGQNPDDYAVIGVSGVTIATGVDLGQTDAATLEDFGVAKQTIALFGQYFGLKSSRALTRLAEAPLSITTGAAEQLDNTMHLGYLNRYVRPNYERFAGVSFDSLPKQAQAVIFSVCYQKGCSGVRKDWPKLWGRLIAQDWEGAAKELKYGFTKYVNRRRREGTLLSEIVC